MAKRLVSFRIDEERLKDLQEAANVYTNGNCTKMLELLIQQAAQTEETHIVYTSGKSTKLSTRIIKEICKCVGLHYNPQYAFNIYAYWG